VILIKNEKFDKWWEITIASLGIYFSAYTMAKDKVEEPLRFNDILIWSAVIFLALAVAIILITIIVLKYLPSSDN